MMIQLLKTDMTTFEVGTVISMRNKLCRIIFTVLLVYLASQNVYACLGGGESSRWTAKDAASKATSAGIVVFQKDKKPGKGGAITIKLLTRFFGKEPELLSMDGLLIDYADDLPTLEMTKVGHTKLQFWNGKSTNSQLNNSCKIFSKVLLGKPYLLMHTKPTSKFILEPIWDENDQWMQHIKNKKTNSYPAPIDFYSFVNQSKKVSQHHCSTRSSIREVNSICSRNGGKGSALEMNFEGFDDPLVFHSSDNNCFDFSSIERRIGIRFSDLPAMKYCLTSTPR